MKKRIAGILLTFVVAVSSCVFAMNTALTAKADGLDNADRYFLDFLLSDTNYVGEVDFDYSPLYDESLNVHGREYTFTIGNVSGYALLVEFYGNEQVFYEIEELFYNAVSPFADCVGLPVYISHRLYIDYHNGAYYNLQNNQVISADVVSQLAQKGFKYFGGSGNGTFVQQIEILNYATKATTANYSIQFDLPNYYGASGTSCANTAGAVVLGYYDRFYENLIPNFQTYVTMGPLVAYKAPGQVIINLTTTLSNLMLIGEPHEGTTFAEFQYGMETYVEEQGFTYSTTNVFLNGSFNLDRYKNSVNANKPVALFMLDFAMLNYVYIEDTGVDEISSGYCGVSHVAIGCGYKTDTYYDASGNVITTRTYLKVASGMIDYGVGYLNINGITDIRNAISIQIS